MPLPVLGLIAKFVVANGVRAATRKYGVKAVEKATKQIKARQKAIDKNVEKAKSKGEIPLREKTPLQTQKARETRLVNERNKRMKTRSTDGEPMDEVPLQFSKGGGVYGRKKMMYGGMARKKKMGGGKMNKKRMGMAMGGAMKVQKPN
jgi:hypothetical protein|tara:strand:- start:946 stop:1389 length:444 start_codon:yes stop_codon:yes gene_type:complete